MNLSMNWLSDYVNTDGITIKEYCDRMTDTGSKVESYEILGNDIENVVVARILKVEAHPDSDHLQICQMDIGKDEPVQIITGAQNIFEGAIVPAAIPVAKLPGDVVIKAGKLRGLPSNGMLCSIGELGLTEHDMPGANNDGILILGDEFADKIGMDIKDALMLKDSVVEFEITSNRPDCLSVLGLARESAISFDREFNYKAPIVKEAADSDNVSNYISVNVEAEDLCQRYSARVIKNVKVQPSPLWLRMRLRASGIRPINNIVDITNYVMLEYGQPMHAFDYKCLDGAQINVRRADNGENFRSLDSVDHKLDNSMLVIADKNKAVALAGVMGGENSEISDETTTVVFESACFLGSSVRVTAKKNGMRTESSSRYEKGLDPENTIPSVERACELIQLLDAGEVVNGIIDVYPNKKALTVLPLEVEKINKFLGVNLSADYMKDVLTKLECKIESDKIIVPSFRNDLTNMNDIAEEIIRIYGYNKIESTAIRGETTMGGRTPKQKFEYETEKALLGMGLDQINTFSFISPKSYDKIRLSKDSALRNSIVISNPLGEDTSIMRTTAIPSMLDILARNFNYNNEDVQLFELASTYIPNEDASKLPSEKKSLTIGMYGNVDFYNLKGIIENIITSAGIKDVTFTSVTDNPVYHPGRCAKAVTSNGAELATFGQVHPLTAANYGIDKPVYVSSVDFDKLFEVSHMHIEYTPLPKFPAITRDFSFVCEENIEVGTIENVMAKAGGNLVEDIKLFDIYRGHQLGDNMKSVSLRVTLRALDRTLTVEEVDKIAKKILNSLSYQLGIGLRA